VGDKKGPQNKREEKILQLGRDWGLRKGATNWHKVAPLRKRKKGGGTKGFPAKGGWEQKRSAAKQTARKSRRARGKKKVGPKTRGEENRSGPRIDKNKTCQLDWQRVAKKNRMIGKKVDGRRHKSKAP